VRRLRGRTERGATLVEAALVLPILMLLVLGLIDLAMWNFQKSQTSSAARDGARYASLAVVGTDVCASPCSSPGTPSAANTAVKNAIKSRLGNQAFTFTVRCMTATSTTSKACALNSSTVDSDRVEVQVTWTRPAMTFVSKMLGASKTVQAKSIMTISG
jgi:Flp pilus assembly protein TadG